MSDKDKIEGEGSRSAAREYNKDTQEFVESGQVEQKAREAAEASKSEEAEMKKAEEAGKAHAKEEDPALHRDYNKPD